MQALAFPFIVIYLAFRVARDHKYWPHLGERLGLLPPSMRETAPGAVWVHAVSVGEVMAALGLLRRLREESKERKIYVSATTLAGRALAAEKLRGLADGVFYAPIDYRFAVRAVLRRLRPSVVVVLETEIWPNLYREVKRSGAGLLIVNGRISDKAFPRNLRFRWLFEAALAWPDRILAQGEQARDRYLALGAPPGRVSVAGNLKHDLDVSGAAAPEAVRALIWRLQPEVTWIAASTMPPARPGDVDEDDAVIGAFQELSAGHPRLLLILVPRRPARFDEAARKLEAAGVRYARRSELSGSASLELPGVLLLDTIGELVSLFAEADLVFMGGTLAERGGHNILEPAFFGRPVLIGPHMENFPEIAAEFRREGCVTEVGSAGELAGAVDGLLRAPERRREMGKRARALAELKRGATGRAMEEVRWLSDVSVARPIRQGLAVAALWPLTRIWAAGSKWKRQRATGRRRSLGTPVVSVGGIGVGGAGKTPFTLALAERLRAAGLAPAILTRGYRRRAPGKPLVLAAGETAATALTGDEAQILLRSGVAHLGIGADRYVTGAEIERRFGPDVFLLDDGFQHWKLARDFDFVLIDGLDPFAGEALFPLGRQREPLRELRRADAFVITRVEPWTPVAGIAERLRQYNPGAPVFLSRVEAVEWVDVATGEAVPLAEAARKSTAAFCGLANPASFWRSVDAVGCRPVARWTFGDHHHYHPRELQRMAGHVRPAGAEALLTTEKDVMNLPAGAAEVVAPLRLLWLRIRLGVEDEERLLALMLSRLERPARVSRGGQRG